MTKENYTTNSNEELLLEVGKLNTPLNQLGRKVKATNPNLFDEILNRTSFLVNSNIPFPARLHCLEHHLDKQPTCKVCGNPVEWYGKNNDFRIYCSRKCQYSDDDFWDDVRGTCKERLGVENPFQSESVKERIKKRHMENLGVEYPMQSEVVKAKSRESCIVNLGVDNPSQSFEVKVRKEETTFKNYGVKHPLQSEVIKDKVKSTCIERWGYDNFSKSPLFALYHRSRILHDGIWFDSHWEVKVYDFLVEHNIPFDYQIEPIPYEYDGVVHYYFPDFWVNGRIYEVKGDHFFRINESTGKEEMFCPFRYDWSDEYYEWKCGQYEAKHQCMLANNVIILRESDIRNLTLPTFGVVV